MAGNPLTGGLDVGERDAEKVLPCLILFRTEPIFRQHCLAGKSSGNAGQLFGRHIHLQDRTIAYPTFASGFDASAARTLSDFASMKMRPISGCRSRTSCS